MWARLVLHPCGRAGIYNSHRFISLMMWTVRGTNLAVIDVNVNHIHSFLETVFLGFSNCFARVLYLPGLASVLPRRVWFWRWKVYGPQELQTSGTDVISFGWFVLINRFSPCPGHPQLNIWFRCDMYSSGKYYIRWPGRHNLPWLCTVASCLYVGLQVTLGLIF